MFNSEFPVIYDEGGRHKDRNVVINNKKDEENISIINSVNKHFIIIIVIDILGWTESPDSLWKRNENKI